MVSPYQPSGHPTIILERVQEVPHEPESVVDAPLVGFDAFSIDHRVFGWVRLSADRMTDLLNAHADVELVNAQVQGLAGGTTDLIDGLVLRRADLIAVRAGGPRGDPALRQRTRLHALIVRSGPYRIGGFLHARPGVDPVADVEARPPIVPLSLAWLEYWRDGHRTAQWAGTILFNRLRVDSISVVPEEEIALDP